MNDSSLNIVAPGCSIPPNGKAGDSMNWNCWNGYFTPKYFSSDRIADAVCACSESTSTSRARDARTQSGPVVVFLAGLNSFHGTAANANRYVGSGSDSRN